LATEAAEAPRMCVLPNLLEVHVLYI